MDRRTLLLSGGVAVLGGGAYFLTRPGADGLPVNPLAGAANAQSADPSSVPDMILGDPEAPVEVIEYASYTCPHCASFHANQYKELKENYIDTGKIRFVYREVYFDRFGLWASMIARCSGSQDQFFAITNLIYEQQRSWTSSGDPAVIVGELRKLAKIAGLDDATLDACLSDADQAQSLIAWYEQNAATHDVRGTPTFIIDGQKYSNMAYAEFSQILDDKLAG